MYGGGGKIIQIPFNWCGERNHPVVFVGVIKMARVVRYFPNTLPPQYIMIAPLMNGQLTFQRNSCPPSFANSLDPRDRDPANEK